MNIFERAARKQLRFDVPGVGGRVSTEDLFKLPLKGKGPNLDDVGKNLMRKVRESAEESLVDEPSEINSDLTLALDIVKHIIAAKKAEKDAAEKAAVTRQETQKIREALARKRDSELEDKTAEELEAMLAERTAG